MLPNNYKRGLCEECDRHREKCIGDNIYNGLDKEENTL